MERKRFDRSDRPKRNSSRSDKPRSDRKLSARKSSDRNRSERPRSDKPRSDRPRRDGEFKPRSDRPRRDGEFKPRTERSDRPRSDRSRRDGEFKPRSDRPRRDGELKPRTERSDRPRSDRPRRDGEFKPRSDRPRRDGEFKPRFNKFDKPLRRDRRDDRDRRIKKDFHKDPIIPDDVTGEELDKNVRGDLLTLSAENAKIVGQHLSCVNMFAIGNPELAFEHAMAASRHAGRVAMVRETAGYAAYRIGKFDVAIKELRAAFRINGDVSIWPVLADCERGLGKPEKALALAGSPEVSKLQKEQAVEMRIVAAGARRDMNNFEAAVVTLQSKDLNISDQPWSIRLRYAYADALYAAGRIEEAKKWFEKCAEIDVDNETDASERY